MKAVIPLCTLVLTSMIFSGCATKQTLLPPEALESPVPLADSTGEYVAPYTSDGVVAEWVEKAVNAKMGSAIGGTIGAYAGAKAMDQVPFVGGFLGNKVGQSVGRRVAVESSGGWTFIRETSDLSFNREADLAVWLYVNYSTNEHYQDVVSATQAIYPNLKDNYYGHITRASNEARARGVVAPAMGSPESNGAGPESEVSQEETTIDL